MRCSMPVASRVAMSWRRRSTLVSDSGLLQVPSQSRTSLRMVTHGCRGLRRSRRGFAGCGATPRLRAGRVLGHGHRPDRDLMGTASTTAFFGAHPANASGVRWMIVLAPTGQLPMNLETQIEHAHALRRMHHGSQPLLLPNAWDAGSARLFAQRGFAAVATTSGGVAWSLGYQDGEQVPLDEVLAGVARMARVCKLPLSVDFEGGYGATPAAVGM